MLYAGPNISAVLCVCLAVAVSLRVLHSLSAFLRMEVLAFSATWVLLRESLLAAAASCPQFCREVIRVIFPLLLEEVQMVEGEQRAALALRGEVDVDQAALAQQVQSVLAEVLDFLWAEAERQDSCMYVDSPSF